MKKLIIMSLVLMGCSREYQKEVREGIQGHSLISQSSILEKGSLECPNGGTKLKIYLDMDDSLTITESDKPSGELISCNAEPIPVNSIEISTCKTIKVMIIDTGIAPNDQIEPYLAPSNDKEDLKDKHGHGTHVTGLILYGSKLDDALCDQIEIHSCKFFEPSLHTVKACVKKASELGIDIINFSGGGKDFDSEEAEEIKKFKGIFITAAGNSEAFKAASDISKKPYYPASLNYPNMRIVGNGIDEKIRSKSSNYGLPGMIWRKGDNLTSFSNNSGKATLSGSSQATAVYTHEILKRKCQRLGSSR